MSKISILVGNSEYDNLSALQCCEADVAAVHELLLATGEYDHTLSVVNKSADTLKNEIRDFVDRQSAISEIFFYFTGHGVANDQGFFYCAKDFIPSEPNQTGLSDGDLDQILRAADAKAVVKVIDACQSGVRTIKSGSQIFMNDNKAGFSNFFRIASCLENQLSYTGEPLSKFTEHFIDAALQKVEGKLYYTEIIAYLRDIFVNEIDQVPFFVTQGDDRTMFCEDTTSLKSLAEKYQSVDTDNDTTEIIVTDEIVTELSILDKLKNVEESYVQPDQAQKKIDSLINIISESLENSKGFSDYYELKSSSEDSYLYASAAMQAFMIRVLEKQDRPDELVYAKHSREYKKRRRGLLGASLMASNIFGVDDEEFVDQYDLELNCPIGKARTTFIFTPKFRALKKLELNVTIAPSLPICYIFSRWTVHPLKTWDTFEEVGQELERNWYKLNWKENSQWIAESILKEFDSFIERQLAKATGE
ncbi:caspase domain-containing protein [Fretibacter rubidus]|uniref:caspase family protein n=1 Tax=Fretibacter rubidus TaxID=570162 RepID=UPI00352B1B73